VSYAFNADGTRRISFISFSEWVALKAGSQFQSLCTRSFLKADRWCRCITNTTKDAVIPDVAFVPR
jgi:hypothetical protein